MEEDEEYTLEELVTNQENLYSALFSGEIIEPILINSIGENIHTVMGRAQDYGDKIILESFTIIDLSSFEFYPHGYLRGPSINGKRAFFESCMNILTMWESEITSDTSLDFIIVELTYGLLNSGYILEEDILRKDIKVFLDQFRHFMTSIQGIELGSSYVAGWTGTLSLVMCY